MVEANQNSRGGGGGDFLLNTAEEIVIPLIEKQGWRKQWGYRALAISFHFCGNYQVDKHYVTFSCETLIVVISVTLV